MYDEKSHLRTRAMAEAAKLSEVKSRMETARRLRWLFPDRYQKALMTHYLQKQITDDAFYAWTSTFKNPPPPFNKPKDTP